MKQKRVFLLVLTILMSACLLFSLVGCDKKTQCKHIDKDNNHLCDTCGATVSKCVDYDDDHYCDTCQAKISDHTGGTATCQQKATCTICGNAYGELADHNIGLEWEKSVNGHYHQCKNENCTEKRNEGTHTFEDGVCTVCGDYDTYGTEGITYKYDDTTKTYYVDSYNGESTEVTIASYRYDDERGLKPVTYIERAFAYKDVTKVIIPNTVTEIKNRAFEYSKSLTEIVIPDTIEYIGNLAFDKVPWVDTYTAAQPDGDVYIGKVLYTYKGTMPQNYTLNIKEGTVSVYYSAYKDKDNLIAINMPASLLSIGSDAFNYCDGLTAITLGENVKNVADYAFAWCTSVETITFNSKVEKIGNSAFQGCKGSKTLTIPSSVTSIDKYAFGNIQNIESVVIEGSGLTFIAKSAFISCKKLTSITFSVSLEKLKEISDDVWYKSCPELVVYYNGGSFKVHYEAKDKTCTEDGSIEYWYNFLDGKNYTNQNFYSDSIIEGSVVIPAGHSTEGVEWTKNASGHYKLCKYNCGEKLNEGTHTFEDGVCTVCGDYDTYGTEGLSFSYNKTGQYYEVNKYTGSATDVVIPYYYDDGTNGVQIVKSLGYEAFEENKTIKSVFIPAGVTKASLYVFKYCSSLERVTFGENSRLTAISNNMFQYCSKLASIEIPDGVTEIGEQAFYGCTSITSFEIPDSVTTIKRSAFYGSGATSITFGENSGLTTIDAYGFAAVRKLPSIIIPDSVTSIGDEAFSDNYRLWSVTLGSGITESGIGKDIFSESVHEIINKSNLNLTAGSDDYNGIAKHVKLIVTDGVSKIKTDEDGSSYLIVGDVGYLLKYGKLNTEQNITLPQTIEGKNYSIGAYAFAKSVFDNFKLNSITFPDNLISIGGYAFYSNQWIYSINIPASVTSIGNSAFA